MRRAFPQRSFAGHEPLPAACHRPRLLLGAVGHRVVHLARRGGAQLLQWRPQEPVVRGGLRDDRHLAQRRHLHQRAGLCGRQGLDVFPIGVRFRDRLLGGGGRAAAAVLPATAHQHLRLPAGAFRHAELPHRCLVLHPEPLGRGHHPDLRGAERDPAFRAGRHGRAL